MLVRLAALCLFIAFILPAHDDWTAVVWADTGLTLTVPIGWQVSYPETGLLVLEDGSGATIRMRVAENGDPSAVLQAELGVLDLLHYGFQAATLYARPAWSVDAVSRDGLYTGIGKAGYLPDDRVIAAVGRWRGTSVVFDDLLASLSTGDPILPSFQPVWTLTDRAFERVIAGADGTIYALMPNAGGISAMNGATGAVIADYAFEHPTQPTDLAIDRAGVVYVADVVCRCLLRLANGVWLDPVGAFAGNAPLGAAVAPDGTIYAIDRTKEGNYALQVVGEDELIPLNFNAVAPPAVTVSADGQPLLTEWLTSLMDSATYAYISVAGASFGSWHAFPPADITDDGQGGMVYAGSSVAHRLSHGEWEALLSVSALSAALDDDALYVVTADGALTGYRRQFPTTRGGLPEQIVSSGAAFGGLSESAPIQTWAYAGTTGETITINAVDPARSDPYSVSLDMALRVTAPDGRELAYNDDQLGLDLYGAYDAQIADLVLPADGVYSIAVEWVQGQGAYLLGVRSDQSASAGDDGVIRITGTLIDAAPVERWVFAATEGDVITLTMIAQSGDLDPALELLRPDGTRLAYNDDTTDAELGVNAQIYRVRVPVTGNYVVEASRFDGSGHYELVIVQVE
ncbi:MAG: hypothetical protein IAE80_24605 [Anaerolinea sp.]|nr:hypothetical protein [Anaerolinea sp.]